jgi:Flp pilus assembly protein TadD
MACFLTIGLPRQRVGYGHGVTALTYALTECRSILIYAKLTYWPHPLVFDYGRDYFRNPLDAAAYAVGLAIIVTVVVLALRRWPVAGFAGCWFFGILAPSSSFVPVVEQPIAENRPYLPLVAPVAVFAVALCARLGRRGLALCLVIAIVLASVTWRRNEAYATESSLWADTVAKRPNNARAQDSLGVSLLTSGNVAGAIECFEKAASLDPGDASAQNNLGSALLRSGRAEEAIPHFQSALRPGYAEAESNLKLARTTLAESDNNRANALLGAGHISEAIALFRSAVALKPEEAPLRKNFAMALLQAGDVRKAIAQCEEAVRLDPRDPDAINKLEHLRAIAAASASGP